MKSKTVTSAAHYHFSKALQRDLLALHAQVIEHDKKTNAQIKLLQDLAVSQGKRIAELEEDIRPTPPHYTSCPKCSGTGQRMEAVGMRGRKLIYNSVNCKFCMGRGRQITTPTFGVVGKIASALLDNFPLTPTPSSPKTRMSKGGKRGKNNK